MKVEMRDVDKIVPYENNPRHNDGATDAVAASIKAFGWRVPIVVDKDGVIVCGHTRRLAALKLGLKEVPVHVAIDLTPEQVRAYRLADNRSSEKSDWDFEKFAAEYGELSDMMKDSLGDLDFEELLGGSSNMKPMDVSKPPRMAWVLIGVPLEKWNSVSDMVERAQLLDGAIVETTVNDGPKDGQQELASEA